jgi:hypothetical protein
LRDLLSHSGSVATATPATVLHLKLQRREQ